MSLFVACGACLVGLVLFASLASASGRRDLWYQLAEDELQSFRFQVTHSLSTELLRLPPEADDYDVDSVQARITDVRSEISGRLERVVARVFRDRSLGVIARLTELQSTVDRGEGPESVELAELNGKSISMRVHRSGELLDSFGWSHLNGAGRGGDLVTEVLLQPVLRLPYQAPKPGRPVGSTFRLRYSVDGMLERDQNWVLSYERAEGDPPCRGCLVLSYEGSITEASTDKHPARPMVLSGTGSIEGTIVLGAGRARRELLRHDWSVAWKRKLRTERENGTLRGELAQTVQIDGWVEREETP